MFNKLITYLKSGKISAPAQEYNIGSIINLHEFRSGAVTREPGVVALYLNGDELHIQGAFFDSDLFNKATQDNMETWVLGDVFEFMIQPFGHEDYYEFHSTPNGKKLQLHIEDYRTIRQIPHEAKLCECGLKVENSYNKDEQIWCSELIISLSSIGLTAESFIKSRCVFVRQNHWQNSASPEISASQIFPTTAHYPVLWHSIALAI